MNDADETSPVSFLAHVARLPKNGLPVVVEATPEQLRQLAEDHAVSAVTRYRADLLVLPWKRGGVRVTGTVVADVVQECVVTLDPIEAHISEDVEGIFLPENSKLKRPDHQPSGEIVLDAEGPDSPEMFTGDTIDVGVLAEQFFGLAIDPYPRKPGAQVEAADAAADENQGGLFEKLKQLRPKS